MFIALNLTVHTYNEKMAKEIYDKVKEKYFPAFLTFLEKMEEQIK